MATDLANIKTQLLTYATKGKWDEVIRLYKDDPRLHKAKITRSGDTALHLAVSDGNEDAVEEMVKLATRFPHYCKEALQTSNGRKDTALHIAASMGNLRMCHIIAQVHHELVSFRNVDGETPLFLAALHGRKEAFLCLHHLSHPHGSPPSCDNCRRNNGDSILHCTIAGNFYDLAFQIIYLYEQLVNSVNEEGLSPLHLLAAKPSNFKSGCRLGRYEMIIYHCIFVEELKVAEYHHQSFSDRGWHKKSCNLPDNYKTCFDFFGFLNTWRDVGEIFSKGQPNAEDPEVATNNNIAGSESRAHVNARRIYPENCVSCCKFFRLVYLAAAVFLGQGSSGLQRIRRKKEKHVWSVQIMNELLRRASLYGDKNDGDEPQTLDYTLDTDIAMDETEDCLHQESTITRPAGNDIRQWDEGGIGYKMERRDAAILIAAKNGVAEMVEKIIELFPVAINDENGEKKNVVLLAVEHRQLLVYQLLLQRNILQESAFRKVDHEGNSALHLAARFAYGPGVISDAALQIMQTEHKWFQFVKESMPSHLLAKRNKRNKTPKDIFFETHAPLVISGGESLNKTSESCSVVATLVAGVAFATSSTVPGGNDDKTGKPTLKGHPGFDIFAISALIALCFSVTALILFLSIFTSRKQASDFMKKLPVKLFLALSSLFVSILSMFVSFCAAHSFVLEDRFKKAVLPLYAIICLPVYFTIMEFPLYMDLFKGIFMKLHPLYDQSRIYRVIPFKLVAVAEEGRSWERRRRSYD